ncbi:hypothetical protein GQ53DRAFT_430667 [Thozetella sp. PMI_491]|nr:hypothetical protein GQ53DRAFT_430667 [Thozetella sp. PMI_491]
MNVRSSSETLGRRSFPEALLEKPLGWSGRARGMPVMVWRRSFAVMPRKRRCLRTRLYQRDTFRYVGCMSPVTLSALTNRCPGSSSFRHEDNGRSRAVPYLRCPSQCRVLLPPRGLPCDICCDHLLSFHNYQRSRICGRSLRLQQPKRYNIGGAQVDRVAGAAAGPTCRN